MSKSKCFNSEDLKNPSYKGEISRVKRVVGQLESICSMMKDEKYCIDILQQLKAARSAIHSLESFILKTHLNSCIKSLSGEKDCNLNKKLDELLNLFNKCDCGVDCMCGNNCNCYKGCKSQAECNCRSDCECCNCCKA